MAGGKHSQVLWVGYSEGTAECMRIGAAGIVFINFPTEANGVLRVPVTLNCFGN